MSANKKKKKRFSFSVMNCKLETKVSSGMFLFVKRKNDDDGITQAEYIRTLIKNDCNIDDLGNEIKLKK